MKSLTLLLAFSFLIGCDGEKSNVAPSKDSPEEAASEAPSERSPEETASEARPPEAVSVNPNLKYKIEGDAVAITGCDKKASGELIIAAIIEGKPVTSIWNSAFYACTKITSITIPDSVTSIGNGAFYGCGSLTTITIPDGVTSIGKSAFWKCTSLTSITIGDGVTSIGDYAFNDCSSLKSITIPNSVTSIGLYAFRLCQLTVVTFLGDAPAISAAPFILNRSITIIYRNPNAKGWGDTFAGRPVKLITEKP